ncbi:hypothetical protein CASFOL_006138 [Castilleja foliolosa]|uniref:Uncharacterized protein n=1 Tax=Castilleja foliolosa TaxID=1961234 RepID=A0ABD3E9F1_9LAMI
MHADCKFDIFTPTNVRLALTLASPESNFSRNYQNRHRGYLVSTLARSTSVREGSNSRNFCPGKVKSSPTATSSGDLPALSQCLMVEPDVMGDPKYACSGEFRRALGFSVRSNLEENSFPGAHLKNSTPAAVEEIKRLRSSAVTDTCVKASRAKKLDQHLNKLNKICEAMPSKKQQQQRNELLTNELSSGSTMKTAFQVHRNTSDLGSRIFDDRPKSVILNKRVRTSVAEARVEHRSNGVLRQPLIVTEERDMLKDNSEDSDTAEKKIRRLPSVGEDWDKKMKRKRSVGAVFSRSVGNNQELKRNMHHKLTIETTMQASDLTHGCRLGASGGSNRLDPMTSPVGFTARLTLKNEQEKYVLSRDLSGGPIKERPLGIVNVKLNNREDNHAMGSNPVVKRKTARAPRRGPIAAVDSAVNVLNLSGTLGSCEQAPVNKIPSVGGAYNHKRAIPTGSCSPSITQWVGQRPNKITRTRRTNIVPLSNHDEVHPQYEGCTPSDLGSPRINIVGANASHPSKSAANGDQYFKVKPENVPSLVRLSENEESGASEIRINHKCVVSRDLEDSITNAGQAVGASAIPIKKNKIMAKEGTGDGVRRQGRSGRVSPFSRPSISPTRGKLDTVVPAKPFQNERSSSDKIGSKSGRPVKQSYRKGFSRVGNVANGCSPDCSGNSDDFEELFTAANLTCSSRFNACSSPFWKTSDALFASVGPDEKSYLSEQLTLAEELCASLAQNCRNDSKLKLGDYRSRRMRTSDSISCRRNRSMENKNELKDPLRRMDNVEQLQFSFPYGFSDSERKLDVTPLYQRLLSAMIIEDESEESEGTGYVIPRSSDDDSFLNGSENKLRTRFDYCEPLSGFQTWKNGNAHKIFPCNGSADITGIPSAQARVCNGELMQRDCGYVHSEVELLVGLSRCDYVPKSLQANNIGISSSDFQYEQTCLEEKLVVELERVGLFFDSVPELDDNEDEFFNQEIAQLERRLQEHTARKKTCLDKIYKAVQGEKITMVPEQVAMDKLVEVAYKKLLATGESFASKHGISKVPKQVALAFTKRTLARCHKFENSGASCFSEPAFREIVYAAPPRFPETELLSLADLVVVKNGISVDAFEIPVCQTQLDIIKNVPMSHRGKRKEVLLNDVGDGANGKRSQRGRGRNADTKAGRLSMNGSKTDRKITGQLKLKTAQLSMSGNAFIKDTTYPVNPTASSSGNLLNNGGGNMKKNVKLISAGSAPLVSPREMNESMDLAKLPLNIIDGVDELGVDSEIGAPQDINSWLSFEVDGLQDHDGIGLEIPNDDLSELF